MRKQKYETSIARAWEIFDTSPFSTLALKREDGTPYLVNLSMARIDTTLYFHCAMQGEKINALQSSSQVCVSAVSKWDAIEDKFTISYASTILCGKAIQVQQRKEKLLGLKAICERFTPSAMATFDEYAQRAVDKTTVYKIIVESITGKETHM